MEIVVVTLIRRSSRLGLTLGFALAVVELGGIAAAQAAPPVALVALPALGPVGTQVTITGTGFADSSVATSVAFGGTAAQLFTVDSDLQITAIVPPGATTGPVSVTDSEGTGATLLDFVVTPSPPPTILTFLPLEGPPGTSVTITGTGYTGASSVAFNGAAATFDVVSDVQIDAIVPSAATTGPISVTTPGGSIASLVDFTVLAPTRHARAVSLRLRRHLVALGRVVAPHAPKRCVAKAVVLVQNRRHGHWRLVERDVADRSGRYRAHVRDRSGRYRSLVRAKTIKRGQHFCRRAVSTIRTHA